MTLAKYTSGYLRQVAERRLISLSHEARSKGAAVASPICVSGFSLEKSGDLSSSSARTAVLVDVHESRNGALVFAVGEFPQDTGDGFLVIAERKGSGGDAARAA